MGRDRKERILITALIACTAAQATLVAIGLVDSVRTIISG